MAEIRYSVTVDSSGAVTSIQKLDDAFKREDASMKGTAGSAGGLSKAFSGLWKDVAIGTLVVDAVRGGMHALKNQITDTITAAMDQEKADNRLRAALELTGRTVAGNLKHYKDFASAQQQHTIYADEEVQAVQTLLLQMTRLNQEGIDKATKGTMGLAAALGMDLQSAAMMVTKAMEGNYAALQRVGIYVDQNLSAEEQQAQLLEKLGTLYGRATAETQTFAGMLATLKNAWGDAQEEVGNALVQNEGVKSAIVDIRELIREVTPEIKTWLTGLVEFIGAIAKVGAAFLKAFQELKEKIGGHTGEVDAATAAWAKFMYTMGGFTPVTDRITHFLKASNQYSAEWIKKGDDLRQKLWDSFNDIGERATYVAVMMGKFGPEAKKALEVVGGEALKVAMSFEDVGKTVVETGNQGARATKLTAEQLKAVQERAARLNEELRQWRNFSGDATELFNPKKVDDFRVALYGALAPLITFGEVDADVAAGFEAIRQAAIQATEAMHKMSRLELRGELRKKEKELKDLEKSSGSTADQIRKLKEEIRALKGELAEPSWVVKWEDAMNQITAVTDVAFSGLNAIFGQAQKNREIEIENEYKKRLDYINQNVQDEAARAAAIEALEAEFQIKRTSARRAAAKAQKTVSLLEAITNTAAGITGALSNKPWTPFNFVLAAMVAAMGAVQIALIARQPIPLAKGAVFEKPTMFASAAGSNYLAGEAGTELLVPDKKLRDIFRDELRRLRGSGGPTTVVLTLNGKRVAEALLPDLKSLSGQGRMPQDIIGLVRSET